MPSRLPAWLPLAVALHGGAAAIHAMGGLHRVHFLTGSEGVALAFGMAAIAAGLGCGWLACKRFFGATTAMPRLFGGLQAAMALWALAIEPAMAGMSDFGARLAGMEPSVILWRGAFAAACLMIPATLAGASWSVISRCNERAGASELHRCGIQGGGMLAASLAALIAGTFLLREHGASMTSWCAVALNVVSALMALLLPVSSHLVQKQNVPVMPTFVRPVVPVAMALGLLGAVMAGSVLVWVRTLGLSLGGASHAMPFVLATLCACTWIGGALTRAFQETTSWLGAAFWTQCLAAPALAWSAVATAKVLPWWPVDADIPRRFWPGLQLDLVRCAWAVLPVALCWGASFRLAGSFLRRPGNTARWAGSALAFTATALGACGGSVVVGLLLDRGLAIQRAQQALLVVSMVSTGLIAFAIAREQIRARPPQDDALFSSLRANSVRFVVCPFLFLAGMALLPPQPWELAAYGRTMLRQRFTVGAETAGGGVTKTNSVPAPAALSPLYESEGRNGPTVITREADGVQTLHASGQWRDSSHPGHLRAQRMVGHLAALCCERPESALVAGCGAGIAAGSLLLHPSLKNLRVQESDPRVASDILPRFENENHGLRRDARVRFGFDHAPRWIRSTSESFDLILSDGSDSWNGVAPANTVDFYAACRLRLKQGGVMAVWIPLYDRSFVAVKRIVSGFVKIFPEGLIFRNVDSDRFTGLALIGRTETNAIHLDRFQQRLDASDHARVKASLAEVGFRTGMDLLATFFARGSDVAPAMAVREVPTDRDFRLEPFPEAGHSEVVWRGFLDRVARETPFPETLFSGSQVRVRLFQARIRAGNRSLPESDRPRRSGSPRAR